MTIRCLQPLTSLEVLELGNGFIFTGWDSQLQPGPSILTLRHVHTLRIFSDSSFSTEFLRAVAFPNVKWLELRYSSSSRYAGLSVPRAASQVYGELYSLAVRTSTDSQDDEWFCIQGFRENIPLDILLQQERHEVLSIHLRTFHPSPQFLASYLTALSITQVRSFYLDLPTSIWVDDFNSPHPYCPDWVDLLSSMPNVEELCTASSITPFIVSSLGAPPSPSQSVQNYVHQHDHVSDPAIVSPKLRVLRIERTEFGPRYGIRYKSFVRALALRAEHAAKLTTLVIKDTANLGEIEATEIRKHVDRLEWDRCPRWIRPYRRRFVDDDGFGPRESYLAIKNRSSGSESGEDHSDYSAENSDIDSEEEHVENESIARETAASSSDTEPGSDGSDYEGF